MQVRRVRIGSLVRPPLPLRKFFSRFTADDSPIVNEKADPWVLPASERFSEERGVASLVRIMSDVERGHHACLARSNSRIVIGLSHRVVGVPDVTIRRPVPPRRRAIDLGTQHHEAVRQSLRPSVEPEPGVSNMMWQGRCESKSLTNGTRDSRGKQPVA